MRHVFNKCFYGSLALSILMTACEKKKDDDDKDSNSNLENQFSYENVTYDLSNGFLEYFGQIGDDEGYNFDLSLFSTGIMYDEEEDKVSGTGEIIYFEMFSSSSSELAEGTYTYDSESYAAGTFSSYSDLSIGYDTETGDTDKYVVITGGTVTIAVSGSNYTITFDCVNSDDAGIKGHYEGTLHFFDYTAGLKSGKKIKRKF